MNLRCQPSDPEDDEWKFTKPLNWVVCYETGERYTSMREAEDCNEYMRGTIMSYIEGNHRLNKHWELENFEVECYG